jgi:hypothetical protein
MKAHNKRKWDKNHPQTRNSTTNNFYTQTTLIKPQIKMDEQIKRTHIDHWQIFKHTNHTKTELFTTKTEIPPIYLKIWNKNEMRDHKENLRRQKWREFHALQLCSAKLICISNGCTLKKQSKIVQNHRNWDLPCLPLDSTTNDDE